MAAKRFTFFGNSLNEKYLQLITESLKNDGVIIIPTDTVYAFAGSIYSHKAFERICQLKKIKPDKANFSFLCYDLRNISQFTKPFSTEIFRFMKSTLPGPYTFILNANNNVPAIFKSNKKTIGIRVPDNKISLAIIRELENPLIVASIPSFNDEVEYLTNPNLIEAEYGELVDIIVDSGPGNHEPSTVIDCTGNEHKLVREGKGEV